MLGRRRTSSVSTPAPARGDRSRPVRHRPGGASRGRAGRPPALARPSRVRARSRRRPSGGLEGIHEAVRTSSAGVPTARWRAFSRLRRSGDLPPIVARTLRREDRRARRGQGRARHRRPRRSGARCGSKAVGSRLRCGGAADSHRAGSRRNRDVTARRLRRGPRRTARPGSGLQTARDRRHRA